MNTTNSNGEETSPPSWEGLQSMWALNDDDIEVYTVADDDIPYDIAGVPVAGALIVVVVLSACVCCAVFYCSYRQEREGSCCGKRRNITDDEECQSLQSRSSDDIETGLKLMRWDAIGEMFHDEHTEASEQEFDEFVNDDSGKNNYSIQFTAAGVTGVARSVNESTEEYASKATAEKSVSSSAMTCSETGSKVLQDPTALTVLAQKPRCVLCSKHFGDSDIVSESRDPTCRHYFHQTCIVSWLRKRDGCPVCKKSYIGEAIVKKTEKEAEETETSSGGSSDDINSNDKTTVQATPCQTSEDVTV